MWRPLAVRDFRLLWVGQGISILGDQFYLVALPWLVLHLTGSGLILGTLLLTATVPRLVFLLIGGAVSDRVSPHKVMVWSNLLRALVCTILTALVLLGWIKIWHLFALAAAFGMVDAFFSPALRVFIPLVLEPDQLAAGNALLQGSNMLSKFLGPSLAGLLVAAVGTGIAFGFDTGTFVFAAACLILMKRRNSVETAQAAAKGSVQSSFFGSIREGVRYTWSQPAIRSLIIIIAVIEFSFAGPFTVGLASLAEIKFAGGATAFGVMLSVLGGGFLLGTVIAGSVKSTARLGTSMVMASFALAIGLGLLGLVPNVVWACVLLAIIGTIGGCFQLLNAVWFQTKSDPRMRGRVMSVVLLCSYGLTPFSYALAGALTKVSVTFMFGVTGTFLLLASAFCASNRHQIDGSNAG
jgi:MFS family permease